MAQSTLPKYWEHPYGLLLRDDSRMQTEMPGFEPNKRYRNVLALETYQGFKDVEESHIICGRSNLALLINVVFSKEI